MRNITWDTPCWHLIHTHPKQEARAEYHLKTLNIETYVPLYKKAHQNEFTGAKKYELRPLFPRYVFARFKVNDLYHKVRFTRGVHELVCFENQPAVIDDKMIDLIKAREGMYGAAAAERFHPGDEVVITKGPFEKLKSIFERTTSDVDRVVLLLEIVNYQVRVIVDVDSIAKVEGRAASAFNG